MLRVRQEVQGHLAHVGAEIQLVALVRAVDHDGYNVADGTHLARHELDAELNAVVAVEHAAQADL